MKYKVLFLAMSCRDKFFSDQIEKVKQTWAKDIIDGKYGENVEFLSYDGWEKDFKLDRENHVLHCKCEDDGLNTFKKTYYALKTIQENFDYDFIFRTNTSTFVNVPLVLKFIEGLDPNSEVVWASEILSLVEAPVPYPLDLYGRGNGLILSRAAIKALIHEGIDVLYYELCDDVAIGNVLNSYHIKKGEDYKDYLKSFTHGWFRVVDTKNFSNHHKLCEYWNDNEDYDFLKHFMTIQVKQYYHREDEEENYEKVYSIFKDKSDDEIDVTIKRIYEYSKNPNVFIGSILGYIDLDIYNRLDMNYLWDEQCNHKAINDENRDKFYPGKVWY